MGSRWLQFACFMILLHHTFEATSSQSGTSKRAITLFRKNSRRRTPGFFGLITQFVRETIDDKNFVVRNITDIINSEFPSSNSLKANGSTTGEANTRRLTIGEVNNILGRNYRSLVRLFNTQFSQAIQDSRSNIQQYRVELKNSIRPYFKESPKTKSKN